MLHYNYEPDAKKAARHLTERLSTELQANKKVLWLLSGGSNIALSVDIMVTLMSTLDGAADKLDNLTVMLTDERFGTPGHPDSNWQQLIEAGFDFGAGQLFHSVATLMPSLTLQDTCKAYELRLAEAFARNDVAIAQLGMGGDGHIAGILPGSMALDSEEADEKLVVGYDGGDYMRITMTPLAFNHITAGYCFAYGENKRSAIERLLSEDLNLTARDQPAQLLKTLPEAFLYTDYKQVQQPKKTGDT